MTQLSRGFLVAMAAAFIFFTNTGVASESTDDTRIVDFHIKSGTGPRAWNTRENPVEVKVGDTLRIFNDDSVAHYLHTPGAPCSHGNGPFGPGQSQDCLVRRVADPDTTVLYDHQFGPQSRFYVRATN